MRTDSLYWNSSPSPSLYKAHAICFSQSSCLLPKLCIHPMAASSPPRPGSQSLPREASTAWPHHGPFSHGTPCYFQQ